MKSMRTVLSQTLRISVIAATLLFAVSPMAWSGENGFASPADAFKAMKVDRTNPALFSLGERSEFALMQIGIATVASQFSPDLKQKREMEEALAGLMDKHGLVGKLKYEDIPEDKFKAREFATKAFAGVDTVKFLGDILAYIYKYFPPDGEEVESDLVSMEELKIGDGHAKATLVYADGGREPVDFFQLHGRWFVSLQDILHPED